MRTLLGTSKAVIVCFASAIIASSVAAATPAISKKTPLGFEWTVEHGSESDRTVRCSLIVRNLSTGVILAQPILLSGWGQKAEVTAQSGNWRLEASVLVNDAGVSARYEARIRVKGKIIAANTAAVSLGESGDASASNYALNPAVLASRLLQSKRRASRPAG